jgi:hypothetical protein
MAGFSSMAWLRSSASAGGMLPMGSRSRRLLNQSTHSRGGELDRLERSPRSTPVDDFGLVEAVDRIGQRVVVAIADTTDGGLDARLGQAFGVLDGDVLAASVAVMNEASACTGLRSWRACSSASSTTLACAVRDTRQPTMRRAC